MRPQCITHPSRRGEDAAPQDGAEIMIREGRCLWGAVRFKAEGEPVNVRICHCRNCQKAMGSPFFARALFDQKALTVEGETARYASSEALDRVFCKACGTRLFAWRKNPAVAGVALAAFDDRNALRRPITCGLRKKWIG